MKHLGLHRPANGFTLLELLVAVAILSMSLGLIYRATGASLRQAQQMAQTDTALTLLHGLILEADRVPTTPWLQQGASGAYTWQIAATPSGQAPANGLDLAPVRFVIRWQHQGQMRELAVSTLLPVVADPQGQP